MRSALPVPCSVCPPSPPVIRLGLGMGLALLAWGRALCRTPARAACFRLRDHCLRARVKEKAKTQNEFAMVFSHRLKTGCQFVGCAKLAPAKRAHGAQSRAFAQCAP